jgi:multiple antibiotic resistance protein
MRPSRRRLKFAQSPAPLYGNRRMRDFIHTFLLVYAGLFPIVNPVGSAPIFLSMTSGLTREERKSLAGHISFNSVLLLLGSLFIGSHVLEFFGITLPAVRVAGGLVLTAFGWKLLQSDDQQTADQKDSQATNKRIAPKDSFYPLTMPLTVGPGSMSVAITLGSQRPKTADLAHLGPVIQLIGGAVAGLLAIAITVYVCYRFGERMARALGTTGTSVVVRLSAFILLCIGIEILWNGYSAFMGQSS